MSRRRRASRPPPNALPSPVETHYVTASGAVAPAPGFDLCEKDGRHEAQEDLAGARHRRRRRHGRVRRRQPLAGRQAGQALRLLHLRQLRLRSLHLLLVRLVQLRQLANPRVRHGARPLRGAGVAFVGAVPDDHLLDLDGRPGPRRTAGGMRRFLAELQEPNSTSCGTSSIPSPRRISDGAAAYPRYPAGRRAGGPRSTPGSRCTGSANRPDRGRRRG